MRIKLKRFLGDVIFLLGLFLLINLTSLVFQPKNNSQAAGMEDVTANGILGEPEQTIDVLFLTDSVGYCSIIPLQIWRDYGITSYVCGTPAQPLYYTKEFLEKTFREQSPKVVVLEIMPIFKRFEEKEALKNKVEQIFPIFRYHDRWKNPESLFKQEITMKVDYNYIIADKGYRYFTTSDKPLRDGEVIVVPDVAWIPDECKEAVAEIKAFCEKNDAKLIFVSVPNVCTWGYHYYNAMVNLATELEVPYYDLNLMSEEVPIDWARESFDAGEHLNVWGAQKVTAFVGKYLNELGIFEDKRMVKEYEAWNEAQKKFFEGIE